MKDLRFAHYRFVNRNTGHYEAKGGVTLAVVELENNIFRIAGAKCHETDHYCKAEGRVRTVGRSQGPNYKVSVDKVTGKVKRHLMWVELDSKPDLATLDQIALKFLYTAVPKPLMFVNSGVRKKALKYGTKQ